MRSLRTAPLAAAPLIALLLAASLPGVAASGHATPSLPCAGTGCASPAIAAGVPVPLHGLVTTCASTSKCDFVFSNTSGTGWANASPPLMSLRLPGEAATSTSLAYSTYTARLSGYYTYWTVGTFVGTDVNTGKVVYGTTNTNYTITCHGHSGRGGGCTYTYTTDNGTIVVYFTGADPTSTAVACAPSTIGSGGSALCTVTVNDTVKPSAHPSGSVTFVGPYGSTAGFSNGASCTLLAGACSVSYSPPDEQLGTVAITASFAGTPSFYESSARTSVYVSPSGSGGGNSSSTVRFGESGLANGTDWMVTLGGLSLSTTNGSLPFEVQNGTYPFVVGAVPGFSVSPESGNVTVSGNDIGVNVVFTPNGVPVTFSESHLPPNVTWWVNLTGGPSFTSNGTSISTSLPNGNYTYVVASANPRWSASGGSLDVSGTPISVSVTFGEQTFTVTFAETGILPLKTLAKHGWAVVLNGSREKSTTPTIAFSGIPNGSYPVLVTGPSGYVSSASGSIAVHGTSTVTVAFEKRRSITVTLLERGIPPGRAWCVSLSSYSLCTAAKSERFQNLTPGTFTYAVLAPAHNVSLMLGKNVEPLSGTWNFTQNEKLTLVYRFTYGLRFTESGLGSGTWSVSVKGVTLSAAAGSPILFSVGNGSYGFTIGKLTGLSSSASPSPAVVKGAAVHVAVTFSARAAGASSPNWSAGIVPLLVAAVLPLGSRRPVSRS